MAYSLTNLRDDIRNYTEVGSNVLSDAVLSRIIQNAENKILRSIDTDQNVPKVSELFDNMIKKHEAYYNLPFYQSS